MNNKKIINALNFFGIDLIIILATLFIGLPIAPQNAFLVYAIINIYTIIYLIVKKEKSKFSKLDLIVLTLSFSIFIPLITKKCVSLSEEIYIIIKSITIFDFYFAVRQQRNNKLLMENIKNTIIISIFLLCLIGLDEITINALKVFKSKIGYILIDLDEKRIGSLFSYANAMAAVAGFGFFFTVGMAIEEKKKEIKALKIVAAIIMLLTFVLTYSRIAYIIFLVVLAAFGIIWLKQKNIKIIKKAIISASIFILAVIIFVSAMLKVDKDVVVKSKYQKILYTVNANTQYNFKFEIETEEEAQISIIEKNRYFDDLNITTCEAQNGENEINLKTTESTSVIYIKVKGKAKINKCYLNGEKLILQYKFLPTNIVDKIKSISLSNKSANERLTFIKDSAKLLKENWLFGAGGNAWRVLQNKVQSYKYYASEVHSYPLQTFLERGVVGFLALLILAIYIAIDLARKIKEKDTAKILYNLAIIFVLLHSLLDFDMQYFYIELIVFTTISIFIESKNSYEIENIVTKGVLIILCLATIYISIAEQLYFWKIKIEDKTLIYTWNSNIKEEKLKEAWDYEKIEIAKDKFWNFMQTEKYDGDMWKLLKISDFVRNSTNIKPEEAGKIYEYILETENFGIYQANSQMQRFGKLKSISLNLNKKGMKIYAEKVKEQLQKEIETKEKYILDSDKSRYSHKVKNSYKRELEEFLEWTK